MGPPLWLVGYMAVVAVISQAPITDAQCSGNSFYGVQTSSIPADPPSPMVAFRGAPFFPQLEANNRKYFSVKSPTAKAAIILSPTPYLSADTGVPFYLIELNDGGTMKLYVSTNVDTMHIYTSSPTGLAIPGNDFVDLYVEVTTTNINVGTAAGTELLTWNDGSALDHDVNYILVQNYDDGSPATAYIAEWRFCDGAVNLLSSGKSTGSSTKESVAPCDSPADACDSDQAVDGEPVSDVYTFSATTCTVLESAAGTNPAYWYVDLGDMYDVRAVLILNADQTIGGNMIENGLQGAAVYVGSCNGGSDTAAEIKENAEYCGGQISSDEVGRPTDWIMRNCANYYGRYVTLMKEGASSYFGLCEVEVWGQTISDDNKPKIGFSQSSVSNLEGDTANSMYSVTVQVNDGSAANPTCIKYNIVRATGLTAGNTATTVEDPTCGTNIGDGNMGDDYTDTNFVNNHEFKPAAATTGANNLIYSTVFNNDVTVYYDTCFEADEQFAYDIVPVTSGVLAGDVTAGTSERITFTIENDDVYYCWKDLTMSVLEDALMVTAVLKRTGYAKVSKATVSTVDMGANSATDFTVLNSQEIMFGTAEMEKNVDVIIMNDMCVEETEAFQIMIMSAGTDGQICTDAGGLALESMTVSIQDDDSIFRFQDNGGNNLSPREYTVTETQETIQVVVERQGYLTKPATITVQSQAGTSSAATPIDDYVVITQGITIQPGLTTGSLTVTVVNDKEVEPADGMSTPEEFQLVLMPAYDTVTCGALPGTFSAAVEMADINIQDDDCIYSMMDETQDILEDKGPVAVTVLCERPSCDIGTAIAPKQCAEMTRTFQPSLSTSANGNDDFVSRLEASLTLPPAAIGSTQTSNTFSVGITDDIIQEESETFDVSLTAESDGQLQGLSTTTVKILDDDATVSLICEAINEVPENAGSLTVSLERIGYLDEMDSVLVFTNSITASDGADYTGIPSVVKTFNGMESTLTYDIPITNDNDNEVDESFVVHVRPSGAQTYVDPNRNMCVWTIKDDDCSFTITATEANTRVTEGSASTISVTITRSGSLSKAASVRVNTGTINGGDANDATPEEDFVSVSTEVTFQPQDSEETVTITIKDDEATERTEYFQVYLAEVDCGLSGTNRIIITIDDNDESQVRMSSSKMDVEEDGKVATISIERSGSLINAQTVDLTVRPLAVDGTSTAATAGSDFDGEDISVEFPIGEDAVSVQIRIHDNTMEEGLESFVVEIVSLSPGSDATIDNNNRATVVSIRDNDGTFRLGGDSIERSVSEGSSVTIQVLRSGDTGMEQTVFLSTSDVDATSNVDYDTKSGVPVTFTPGVTSRTVTIDTHSDQDLEPRESFTVFLTSETGNDLGQRVLFINIEDEDNEIHFIGAPGTALIGNDVTVSESDRVLTLTIERRGYSNSSPSGTATVFVSSREISANNLPLSGSITTPADKELDYKFTDTTLTFQSGQTTATVEVTIEDDITRENREAFEIFLSNAQPTADNKIVYVNTVRIYITDDEVGSPSDGGGNGQGGDGTTLSNAAIVGIIGGAGLVVLIIVLTCVALFALSRLRGSVPTAGAPRGATREPRQPVYQYPGAPRGAPRQPVYQYPPQRRY